MNKEHNNENNTKIGITICVVMCILMLIGALYNFIKLVSIGNIVTGIFPCFDFIMSIAILLYLFVGYKKPHGNSLRILFFIFAICLAFSGSLDNIEHGQYIYGNFRILIGLVISFVSGRLNKIEKNRIILTTIGISLVIIEISNIVINNIQITSFASAIGRFGPIITFVALIFAYMARYKEHKEAGLQDK